MRCSITLAALFALAGCGGSEGIRYRQWGEMKPVLHGGQTEGRVALADLELDEHTFAVGALAGLRGEVTIDGGEVIVTRGLSQTELETTGAADHRATMLFLGRARRWREHTVERDVPSAELDDYLGGLVDEGGLAGAGPLPFVVEGPLRQLRLHVIAGECPLHAQMHGVELTRPPFVHETDAVSARIVGIYARGGAGKVTHRGSETHMHAILEIDGERSAGHVERVGLARGAVVRLPLE